MTADPHPDLPEQPEGLTEDDIAFADRQVRFYEAELRRQPSITEGTLLDALQDVIARWKRIAAALRSTRRHET